MMAPDGMRLMHGELELGGHKFFVSDEFSLTKAALATRFSSHRIQIRKR